MPSRQLPVSRHRAPGISPAKFGCANFGIARRATRFVPAKKTKSAFLRGFLLALFLLVPASGSHAQTAAELQHHPAKNANTSDTWPQQAVRGAHAMVATDEVLGSQAGVAILKRGRQCRGCRRSSRIRACCR